MCWLKDLLFLGLSSFNLLFALTKANYSSSLLADVLWLVGMPLPSWAVVA
jgi:hypothetical protein